MHSQSSHRARRWGKKFQPWLEALEGRCCPSITTMFEGGVLTITGNEEDDTASVIAAADGTFTVEGVDEVFEDVSKLVLDLGAGNDTATIDVSALEDLDLAVEADLGEGNDSLDVTADASATKSSFSLDTDAGLGDDAVTVDVGDLGKNADVELAVILGPDELAEGETDTDTLSVTAGDLDKGASFSLDAQAGAGDDTVDPVEIGDLGKNADVTIGLDLGEGNDAFSTTVGDQEKNNRVSLEVDGGVGDDTVTADVGDVGKNGRADVQFVLGVDELTDDETDTDTLDVTAGAVDKNARLSLDAQTGAGDDTVGVEVGDVDKNARLSADVQTGAGVDAVDLVFAEIGDNARANVGVDLGEDNDTFSLAVGGPVGDRARVVIDLEGGDGDDTATFDLGDAEEQIDVQTGNVEDVSGLPVKDPGGAEDSGDDGFPGKGKGKGKGPGNGRGPR
jgi:hypothetical protein